MTESPREEYDPFTTFEIDAGNNELFCAGCGVAVVPIDGESLASLVAEANAHRCKEGDR